MLHPGAAASVPPHEAVPSADTAGLWAPPDPSAGVGHAISGTVMSRNRDVPDGHPADRGFPPTPGGPDPARRHPTGSGAPTRHMVG